MIDLKNLDSKHLKLIQAGLKGYGLYRMKIDGIYGPGSQRAYNSYLGKTPKPAPPSRSLTPPPTWGHSSSKEIGIGGLNLSKESIDRLIYYEVGGEAYYNKKLKGVTLPPGYSSLTIGIGIDLAYYSKSKLEEMLDSCCPSLTETAKSLLIRYTGIKRAQAKKVLISLSWIKIPYAEAYSMFVKYTLPDYAAKALRAYPGLNQLKPNAQGAMVSLVFNRGSSMKGSRRREMLNLKKHVKRRDYESMADEFYSMKRLWPKIRGLRLRRDSEAKLILS